MTDCSEATYSLLQPQRLWSAAGLRPTFLIARWRRNGTTDTRWSRGAIRSVLLVAAATCSAGALGYDPLDCLNDIAKVDPGINVGSATRLCSGTWTAEPVRCYVGVSKVDDGVPRFIAIDLCAGAVDAEKTVACYVRASTEQKLNRGLATTLCGAKKVEKQQ